MAVTKRWQEPSYEERLALDLAGALGLPPPMGRVLAGRGWREQEALDAFLHPRLSALTDPFALPAMGEAVDRTWQAIETGERITVFGDYDVDGITSTALLTKVLAALGGEVQAFLPHRVDEGYGLSEEALARCLDDQQPALIITVDCGTSSVRAVEGARARGVDVVVTDHHEPGEETAPAVAVVNPKLGTDERLRVLAGVGCAFKFCHAMLKRGREARHAISRELDLRDYLDLVALGTISDLVPLEGENRIFARHGLLKLAAPSCPGLVELSRVAGVAAPFEAYHVGFILGPRLNAAGRLGDARKALQLLMTSSPHEAGELARELDATNRERQQVEKETVEEAEAWLDQHFDAGEDYAVVVAGAGWHPGVVGIVASRLAGNHFRPAVVLAETEEGVARGSCRSIPDFNMVEGLAACAELLTTFGGHAMAAGLELPVERVRAFRERFNEVAREALQGRELRPEQRIDAWMTLGEADRALVAAHDDLRPFGLGNPTPVFATREVRPVGEPRTVGTNHLKLTVGQGSSQVEAIGFGMADHPLPEGAWDIAYHVKLNAFRGRETLQLSLQDIRPSGS